MYLVSWDPHLSDELGWYLYATAVLKCPVCAAETDTVKTAASLVGNLPCIDGEIVSSLEQTFERSFGPLLAQRSCEQCGVVSVMPKAERERLFGEAAERVTKQWLHTEGERAVQAWRERSSALRAA